MSLGGRLSDVVTSVRCSTGQDVVNLIGGSSY